ncbi:MAG: carbamoyl-phosphate synthase (glutamine-hydrolyzing) [Rhodothalassiaceae bacterium]|nr:MAG: carbamoyl-phosphate synthase (glutamine-hydrolyzing) [Rhodothalassiaceae bacterium]
MPKRTDIESILIIGAGPIIIGQACEFDYSGTQAVKALTAEGYRVILVNSNPATIMTDPELADATYIEPITPEIVTRIIEKERPDALLPTMGGQTALNCALALHKKGVLKRLGVELIGANAEAIEKAEDRELFRVAMERIGLEVPRSRAVTSMEEALEALDEVGLPAIIRPSFTLGGTGGGIAYNREEFEQIVRGGLDASPVHEVLVEESVLGWKEYEMEVVRDRADNCIIVCSIENVDPMGVHTGDSITVAPALTLTDREYQEMRNASIAILREIGVETGGSNVQFAVDPRTGRQLVIEMNPRVSRSSALASKATGFPIAKVAARLAVGYTLDEIMNDITGVTPASFEPTIDYVVTKVPRFTFEKFPGAEPVLTTSMRSVGEAMAIGRNFPESLQKALRSLETGLDGLDPVAIEGLDPRSPDRDLVLAAVAQPAPDRLLKLGEALRLGFGIDELARASGIDPWFIAQIKRITDAERALRDSGLPADPDRLRALRQLGFSVRRLAELSGTPEDEVVRRVAAAEAGFVFKRVDTCAAEFEARTPYLYSSVESPILQLGEGGTTTALPPEDEARVSDRRKVVILGGGPNRIGQGIEFDYCCCHAAFALAEEGVESIMINCNPETVSTDYDTSDRLYFEPLAGEHVLSVIEAERSRGALLGVILQFGGQTPLKLAKTLEAADVPVLGTSPDAIDCAEDRDRFAAVLAELGLRQPANGIARSVAEAEAVAERIGYPVLLRPSYVLGGRAMEIVHDRAELQRYMRDAVQVSGANPVLVDRYLKDATEVDVDALGDGEDVYVAGIMEHIEEAGIHSGDSACSLPPFSLTEDVIEQIVEATGRLGRRLAVRGLMNVQFAVKDGEVFVLEVNPRASRTVPFVSKTIGVPLAKMAVKVMLGARIRDLDLPERPWDPARLGHVAVKESVFPFARFPGVDVLLGPEMKSTGEVMGIDRDFARAFLKSQLAAGVRLPQAGLVFISVKDADKPGALAIARELVEMGYALIATRGTAQYLTAHGVPTAVVNKVAQGRPHIVDYMKDGKIDLMFNTTEGAQSIRDSYEIRRTALMEGIPYYTTMAEARAAVTALKVLREGGLEVRRIQDYAAAPA